MRIRKSGLSLLLTFALAISTISGWSDVAAEPINDNQIVANENAAKCANCDSVMKHVEGTEPTCSMFGIKEYWTCSNYDCEEANNIIFFEEECETRCQWGDQKIEMVPHSLVEKTVDKCDGSGTITYYVCYEGCSLEAVFAENDLTSKMNRSELISKLGHQMATVLELIPTCQHEGMLQHYKCMKCEKHFIDTINFEETTLEEMTLPPLMHIWSNDYYFDDAEHWKQCLYVGCRSEVAAHVYDQNIVNEEWRVADANCVHGTLYYKSCVCGKAGTETFEADAPLSRHDLTTSWVHDENNHWYECEAEGCDYVEAMSEHVYDLIVMEDKYLASDADCQSKAKYYMSCECGAAGTTTV